MINNDFEDYSLIYENLNSFFKKEE